MQKINTITSRKSQNDHIALLFFFFESTNIIESETLTRRKESERTKNNDAAYRRNIQKLNQTIPQKNKTVQVPIG